MSQANRPTSVTVMTADRPGAVAVLQLHGPGTVSVLERVTGCQGYGPGQVRLAEIAGIDRGLVALIRGGEVPIAQLMPHGGPRVVGTIIEALAGLGVRVEPQADPLTLFPEADSAIQAEALCMVARSASPAAVDVLLDQPRRWREALQTPDAINREQVLADSCVLDRLINPPTVVVVGLPNVGKSTLTNRLMGRAVSLVADLPGTTRDWVGAMVELGFRDPCLAIGADAPIATTPHPGSPIPNIAVRWLDTPGLRGSSDTVEQRAISIARDVMVSADVLVVMRDPVTGWPGDQPLPREPDVRVVNKIETPSDRAACSDHAIEISAKTGRGVDLLQQKIIEALGFAGIGPDALWAFSPALRAFAGGATGPCTQYVAKHGGA